MSSSCSCTKDEHGRYCYTYQGTNKSSLAGVQQRPVPKAGTELRAVYKGMAFSRRCLGSSGSSWAFGSRAGRACHSEVSVQVSASSACQGSSVSCGVQGSGGCTSWTDGIPGWNSLHCSPAGLQPDKAVCLGIASVTFSVCSSFALGAVKVCTKCFVSLWKIMYLG